MSTRHQLQPKAKIQVVQSTPVLISIVVPVYQEEESVAALHNTLSEVLDSIDGYDFEILFINDGSTDATDGEIQKLQKNDPRVKYLEFSRNFGKEIATTAGIHHAEGDAVLLMDADLQHPPHYIPSFITEWENGSEIVIGVRSTTKDTPFRKVGSYGFHKLMSLISDTELVAGETDFRLMDRKVVDEFNRFTEKSRMTRSLINWLGFRRTYVYFESGERSFGTSSFHVIELFRLAMSGFVQHSLAPLRLASYLGALMILVSGVLGVLMFTDKFIYHMGLNFSGPAILGDILLFMIGIVLIALGMIAVYIGVIHQEAQDRPLYVLRRQ
jgi:glycosyltransferase involved in cell wall biosynthesis